MTEAQFINVAENHITPEVLANSKESRNRTNTNVRTTKTSRERGLKNIGLRPLDDLQMDKQFH